jgi:hypothetical protein
MNDRYGRILGVALAVVAVGTLVALSPRVLSQGLRATNGSGETFLPLLFAGRNGGTPTPTVTPTATATPTPPACPVDDVTGSYLVETSNLEEDCPGGSVEPPEPATIEITQAGTALTLSSASGDATGTIDPQTGDFEVVATIDADANLCPFGCQNTTTGAFQLGQNPMVFAGSGELEIFGLLGGTFCTVTYELAGTRTGCADTQAASRSGAVSTAGRISGFHLSWTPEWAPRLP